MSIRKLHKITRTEVWFCPIRTLGNYISWDSSRRLKEECQNSKCVESTYLFYDVFVSEIVCALNMICREIPLVQRSCALASTYMRMAPHLRRLVSQRRGAPHLDKYKMQWIWSSSSWGFFVFALFLLLWLIFFLIFPFSSKSRPLRPIQKIGQI